MELDYTGVVYNWERERKRALDFFFFHELGGLGNFRGKVYGCGFLGWLFLVAKAIGPF